MPPPSREVAASLAAAQLTRRLAPAEEEAVVPAAFADAGDVPFFDDGLSGDGLGDPGTDVDSPPPPTSCGAGGVVWDSRVLDWSATGGGYEEAFALMREAGEAAARRGSVVRVAGDLDPRSAVSLWVCVCQTEERGPAKCDAGFGGRGGGLCVLGIVCVGRRVCWASCVLGVRWRRRARHAPPPLPPSSNHPH